MSNSCHFLLQKQAENAIIRKFIGQKHFNWQYELGDQIRSNLSSVKAEILPKDAFMPSKHTNGTLSANKPETIRMLKT